MMTVVHPETSLMSVLSGRPIIRDQLTNKICYLDNRQEVQIPPEFIADDFITGRPKPTKFTKFTELSNGSILWYGVDHYYQIQMTNGEYSQRYEIQDTAKPFINTAVELHDSKITFGTYTGLYIIDITKPIDAPVFHIDSCYVNELICLENKLLVSTTRKIITVDLTTMSVLEDEIYSFSSDVSMIKYNGEVLTASRDGIITLSGTVYSRDSYFFNSLIKLRHNVFVVSRLFQPNAIEIWINGVKRHTLTTFGCHLMNLHRINSYSFAVHVIDPYTPPEIIRDSAPNFTLVWTDPRIKLLRDWRYCFAKAYRGSGERDRRKCFHELTDMD